MTTKHHPIRNGIIATVVGGLILALIFDAFEKLPAIVRAIAEGVSYVFGAFGTDLALPMWLLAFGVSVVVISAKRRFLRWVNRSQELSGQTSTAELVDRVVRQQSTESDEPETESIPDHGVLWDGSRMIHPQPEPELQLDKVQQAIMKLFGDLDTDRLSINHLCSGVPFAGLEVQHAVMELKDLGLLRRCARDVRGDIYGLTTKGTAYVIEQGRTLASNESELHEAQKESVDAEEYEEGEEDWRSYTSDNILGIDWRWLWHGTSIENLTALCPKCELELRTLTSPEDPTGLMTGEQLLNGFVCLDGNCGWSDDFSRDDRFETLTMLHEYVKKHIRREARRMGLPTSKSSSEPELDEVQHAIMKRFGFSDLPRLHIDQIYNGVQFGRLKVQQALMELEEFGFLERVMVRGYVYNLTSEGTKYIIEQGWSK